ncbi:hypothetical protein PR048_006404 [Dryococelus australis]|uniref:Uncharacterized protein n=1 Tax=Dryococelus australis TaxID=614101 RepID=A0ABQ9IB00_9NEOP|nr:hypothetical protein PR048_006404 [Dryococelus australis]
MVLVAEPMRFASKKAGGSTRNRKRNQRPKHRGVRVQDGGYVQAGTILATQFLLRFHPGLNMRRGGMLGSPIALFTEQFMRPLQLPTGPEPQPTLTNRTKPFTVQRSASGQAGMSVGFGKNGTLFALEAGRVAITCEQMDPNWDHTWIQRIYEGRRDQTIYKKYFNVIAESQHIRFKLIDEV